MTPSFVVIGLQMLAVPLLGLGVCAYLIKRAARYEGETVRSFILRRSIPSPTRRRAAMRVALFLGLLGNGVMLLVGICVNLAVLLGT